jgi:predicted  nucleic acid-binding Zn-ribbon protein
MLPDLERLIHLQDLESRSAAAQRVVASAPERIAALDARLAADRAAVEAAKAAIAQNQTARRMVDKDLAASQQRLDKYKDQSMAVKTNHEFHAMQQQMAAVKAEIDSFESQVLEIMMGADDLASALQQAELQLKTDEAAAAAERNAITAERTANQAIVETCAAERAAIVAGMTPSVVALFDKLIRARGGIGIARAEKERCIVCQVRLRPMVFSAVVRNDEIVQCDSCQRILYFVPPTSAAATPPSSPPPPAAS